MAELKIGPFSDRIVGYCTNVHAGATLSTTRANLEHYAVRIRRLLGLDSPLDVGLWLAAETAEALVTDECLESFVDWLDDHDLRAFAINGFPFHDFHMPPVKHMVYVPHWGAPEREYHTRNLISIMAALLTPGLEAGISTLPVGWLHPYRELQADLAEAAARLESVAQFAHETKQQTGRLIHIDIEPEPGCFIESSLGLVRYFQEYFKDDARHEAIHTHLRVCHDICHAAVMFEDQAEMFRRYDDAGIKIGKVQVSNAIRVDFDALSKDEKTEALQQLKAFEEDRYLHQTCIRDNATGAITFHEDLPLATKAAEERGEPIGEWRVHFHVPIYLESFGLLGTTRDYIDDCLELMKPKKDVKHFEVETYAWNVLPKELQKDDLAEGIADELIWLRERMGDESKS